MKFGEKIIIITIVNRRLIQNTEHSIQKHVHFMKINFECESPSFSAPHSKFETHQSNYSIIEWFTILCNPPLHISGSGCIHNSADYNDSNKFNLWVCIEYEWNIWAWNIFEKECSVVNITVHMPTYCILYSAYAMIFRRLMFPLVSANV